MKSAKSIATATPHGDREMSVRRSEEGRGEISRGVKRGVGRSLGIERGRLCKWSQVL